MGADQTGAAVGDHQQRDVEPPALEVRDHPGPGVIGLVSAWFHRQQHRTTRGGDPIGHQHRLRASPLVHLEVRTVQEQVVDVDVDEAPVPERLELVAESFTDP